MRDVTQQYVLWTNPQERAALRMGFAMLVVGSLVAGGIVGYAVGRKRRKK